MKPNLDLPTESNPEQSDRIADAIIELLEKFHPTNRINGAQIFEMLNALAIVTSSIITNTGEHAPEFDSHFLSRLARENLINMGVDPDAEEDTE